MWFDGFLVTTGWLDMLGLLNVGMDPMILRVVRLVRLVRLLKVVIVKGRFEWERLRNLIDMAGVGVKGGVDVVAILLVCRIKIVIHVDQRLQ